jgi:hypothetical protein
MNQSSNRIQTEYAHVFAHFRFVQRKILGPIRTLNVEGLNMADPVTVALLLGGSIIVIGFLGKYVFEL